MSWTSVSIRREPRAPRSAISSCGSSSGSSRSRAQRVVDVVVDVGDPVDEAHDLPFEGRRLPGPGVVEDPVAGLLR